jgi:predicted nucleic acid-binding protein
MSGLAYFVDTGIWHARWHNRDQWHHIVDRIMRELTDQRVSLFTTDVVILEYMTLARNRGVPLLWIEQRVEAIEKQTEVICTGEDDMSRARQLFVKYGSISFSGCDIWSVAVMERLGLSRILTIDDQFIKCNRFVDVRPNSTERRIVLES